MGVECNVFLTLYEYFIQYNPFPQSLMFYSCFNYRVYEFCTCRRLCWSKR